MTIHKHLLWCLIALLIYAVTLRSASAALQDSTEELAALKEARARFESKKGTQPPPAAVGAGANTAPSDEIEKQAQAQADEETQVLAAAKERLLIESQLQAEALTRAESQAQERAEADARAEEEHARALAEDMKASELARALAAAQVVDDPGASRTTEHEDSHTQDLPSADTAVAPAETVDTAEEVPEAPAQVLPIAQSNALEKSGPADEDTSDGDFAPLAVRRDVGALFADAAVRSTLNEQLLVACIHLADDVTIAGSAFTCGEAKYLRAIETLHATYQPRADKRAVKRKAPPLADLTAASAQKGISYQQLFEEYIIAKKVFKMAMDTPQGSRGKSNDDFASYCDAAGHFAANGILGDMPVSSCPAFQGLQNATAGALLVPKVTTNSYFYNMRVSEELSGNSASAQERGQFDYFSHWPSVVRVEGESAKLHQCPANMNMVLWTPSDSNVIVRLFHRSDAFKFGLRVESSNAVLHHPRFSNGGFTDDGKTSSTDANFAETTLSANEYLFVPHTVMVSLGIRGAGSGILFRTCVVDASNLNVFRESLATIAKASAYESKLIPRFFTAAFNISMDRVPGDMSMRSLFDRRNAISAGAATTADGGGADAEGDSGEKEAAVGEPVISKRDRRNRENKKVHKDWTAANRWRTMLVGVTIPPAAAVAARDVGREYVSLEWTSAFNPKAEDKTRFGFNLTFCTSTEAEDVDEDRDRALTPCSVTSLGLGDTGSALHVVKPTKPSETDDSSGRAYRTRREGLHPSTTYRVQMTAFYDRFESHASEWTTFTTASLSAPASFPEVPMVVSETDCVQTRLTFRAPLDDGGLPILGYEVFVRQSSDRQEHLPLNWNWWGRVKAFADSVPGSSHVTVMHLLPNTEYQFKLQAFNKLGNSTFSLPSGFTKTTCSRPAITGDNNQRVMVVHGSDSVKHFSIPLDFETKMENLPKPLITLDDTNQKMWCSDHSSVLADVWTSHYSPRLFNVIAETAVASPYLLQTKLENPEEIYGKIAVVQRGVVPIVYKVHLLQAAGAVGVIIADDGRCTVYDQACAPGATKSEGEYWARQDVKDPWLSVRIPVVLIRRGSDDAKLGRCLDFPRYVSNSQIEEL